jgi:hypothetical protein
VHTEAYQTRTGEERMKLVIDDAEIGASTR